MLSSTYPYHGKQQEQQQQEQQMLLQQQQQQQAQAQIITVYRQGNDASRSRPNLYEHYKSRPSIILGWVQIGLAATCLVCNIIGIALQNHRSHYVNHIFYTGGGIWAALFFFAAGGLAIAAAKYKTRCLVINTLALSVIATICGFELMEWAVRVIVYEKEKRGHYKPDSLHAQMDVNDKMSYALAVLILMLSFVLVTIAIWTSALGCAACCQAASTEPGGVQGDQVVPAMQSVVYYGQPMSPTGFNTVAMPARSHHPVDFGPGTSYSVCQGVEATQPPPAYTSCQSTYSTPPGHKDQSGQDLPSWRSPNTESPPPPPPPYQPADQQHDTQPECTSRTPLVQSS